MTKQNTSDDLNQTAVPSTTFLTASQDYEPQITINNTNNAALNEIPSKHEKKKAVTFKTGLFLSEREFTAHHGALVSYDSLGFNNFDESFGNLVFSKFIIKPQTLLARGSAEKKSRSFRAYTENTLSELSMSANENLQTYEYAKNLRMNMVLHDQALRHLARLTRIFVSFIFIYSRTPV